MLAFFSVPALMANFSILPDSALLAFSDNDLQNLLNGFSNACDDFGLTISLKKTKIMTQDTEVSSSLFIKDYALETVKSFIYLGSTVTSTTSLDTEIGKRIGHAATNMSKLSHRVWENQKLTTPTKMAVYCLLSTVPVYIPRYNSTFRKKHHLRMCVYKPLGDASRKQA